jgi:hypothetical protein
MTHPRTTDTAQNNITIPNKKSCMMYENLSILQKNGLLMKNQGLGIHSAAKNTPKYFKTYSAHLPNRSKYLGYPKVASSSTSWLVARLGL